MSQDAGTIGSVIAGRYRLVAALGQGGMGAVYRAIQEPLGRSVAVKLLSRHTSKESTARERFSREARTLSRLSHPNIVVLHDFGEMEDGTLYLVMEEVRGRSLREVMDEAGAMDTGRASRLAWGIARGLAAAHAEGIVHSDLKPENVMVVRPAGESEQVKLLDFGLARLRSEAGATVTEAGMIVGTPRYISPEQIQGVRDEPRSDLYALGVMLYEMVTGEPPFDAASAAMLLVQHLSQAPTAPSERGAAVPPTLDALVAQLLQKPAAARPATANEVMERLAQELQHVDGPPSAQGKGPRGHGHVTTVDSLELSWPPRVVGAPRGDVTLVFTDIQGSSRLWDKAPAVMRDALAEHDRLMREALAEHEGYEVKTQGDAFMVAFADEEGAVRFCVSAQEKLLAGAWSDELLALEDARVETAEGGIVHRGLRVRMGIYRGQPDARPDPNTGRMDYFGPDVNRAARVEAAATGGQVLVGGARAAEPAIAGVPLEPLGEHALKGITDKVPLANLLGGPMARRRFPPLKTAEPVSRTNIVEEDTPFVGREEDVRSLAVAMGQARLVTLLGPGGTGKTRLATRYGLAEAHGGGSPGGAWLADLTEARSVHGVMLEVARTLGMTLGSEGSVDDASRQVGDALKARGRCVLILDNFEQVVEHGQATVGRWLELAPEARVLVTSRIPLDLGPEHRLELGPLDEEAAVQLFAARAGLDAAGPDRADIAALTARLDGMPLAIELAAARARLLTPAQILERLDQRFDLLKEGRRDRTSRQTTLRGAIDWSWELLSEDAREAFVECAVFAGGFTLEAAEAIIRPKGETPVIDLLQILREQSLLRTQKAEAGGQLRFRMYETIRAYAEDKLEAHPEKKAAFTRHADWYVERGLQWMKEIDGPRPKEHLDRLSVEQENLLAVSRRFEADEPLRAVKAWLALDRLAEARSPQAIRSARMDELVRLAERAGDVTLTAQLLIRRATVQATEARSDEALDDLAEAQDLIGEDGDEVLLFEIIVQKIRASARRADVNRAREFMVEAEPLFQKYRRSRPAALYLASKGFAHLAGGEFEEGADLASQAARVARRIGDKPLEATLVGNRGVFAAILGQLEDADRCFTEAHNIWTELENDAMAAMAEGNLGLAALAGGDLERAERLLRSAVKVHAARGGRVLWCADSCNLIACLLEKGDLEEAEDLLEEVWTVLAPLTDAVREQALYFYNRAFLSFAQGDVAGTRHAAAECAARFARIRQMNVASVVDASLEALIAIMDPATDAEARAAAIHKFQEVRDNAKHMLASYARMLDRILARAG